MQGKFTVNVISESEFTIQGHGVHTAFIEMVHGLRHMPDIEVLTNSRNPSDIVHIHTVGPFALRFLLSKGAKKVISAHIVPESWIGSLKFAKVWAPIGAKYLKFFYNRADVVVAVSDEVKTELIRLGVRCPIEVIYNSIDTSRYETTKKDKAAARKKLKIASDTFVVMGSGQIQPRKRFDIFLKLAEELPNITFVWVGGVPFKRLGDDYGHIQKQIKEKPDNFIVTGVIKLEQVTDYYKAADMFLLPSIQETFGLVVVEAAAAGLPVVVRDIPDYDHTFKNDVVRGNDETFGGLVQKLHSDKEYYEQNRQKSAQLAARLDSKATTKQLVKIYRHLLGK